MGKLKVPSGTVHKVPADLRTALADDDPALAAWNDITPLARNEWICWVEDAKLDKTHWVDVTHDFRSDHDRLFHPGNQDRAASGLMSAEPPAWREVNEMPDREGGPA